ncbi:MAG: hypothetical protein IT288_17560 [Bdellovibrionales bacterium]|nr:hypothetical protein [Bdellovibrionales bacterium]
MKHSTQLRKFILPVLLALMSTASIHCSGGSGVASKVDVSVVPERPVVIDTDFTLRIEDGDGDPDTFQTEEITAPWFPFSYTVKNNSSEYITIVNFKFTVTGRKGTESTSTTSELSLDDLGTNVTYLEEIGPGRSASRFTDVTWYIHTLPANVDNFSYKVKVEVQGWVGKATDPKERFDKELTFTTQ